MTDIAVCRDLFTIDWVWQIASRTGHAREADTEGLAPCRT